MNKIVEDIKNIIDRETYLEFDFFEDGEIQFFTRENGCVGSETVGQADVDEAEKAKALVLAKYPNLDVEVDEVDEWVHLVININ
jgi:hypothetical protein